MRLAERGQRPRRPVKTGELAGRGKRVDQSDAMSFANKLHEAPSFNQLHFVGRRPELSSDGLYRTRLVIESRRRNGVPLRNFVFLRRDHHAPCSCASRASNTAAMSAAARGCATNTSSSFAR